MSDACAAGGEASQTGTASDACAAGGEASQTGTASDACAAGGEASQRTASDASGRRPGPLAGLLVADFSRVLAGPYATMLLADLGADVIKVEGPDGDDTRRWVPPTRDGVATYYLAINRNKRSVALNLAAKADRAVAAELARRADVMVENFKPGGLRRFGLDYESVSAANPGIIYASVTGFGEEGGAQLPGYDILVQAVSGLMSLTGEADGPPLRSGISLVDIICGLHTAIGILSALHHREATGAGQRIQSSLLTSALSGMANQSSAYVAGGKVPYRMGNNHPSLFPYNPLPTADGEMIIAVGNDRQFAALCAVIGAPELAADPRYAANEGRTSRREELRALLAERLAARPSAQWFGELTAAGVPCGPINTVEGGVALAAQLGLEPVVTAGEGRTGVPSIRNPLTFSATPPRYDLPPPALDEHGDQIRAWLAAAGPGMTPDSPGQHSQLSEDGS